MMKMKVIIINIITSAKEVMCYISISLVICLLAGLCKPTRLIFSKFGGMMTHGPQKKLLDVMAIRITLCEGDG